MALPISSSQTAVGIYGKQNPTPTSTSVYIGDPQDREDVGRRYAATGGQRYNGRDQDSETHRHHGGGRAPVAPDGNKRPRSNRSCGYALKMIIVIGLLACLLMTIFMGSAIVFRAGVEVGSGAQQPHVHERQIEEEEDPDAQSSPSVMYSKVARQEDNGGGSTAIEMRNNDGTIAPYYFVEKRTLLFEFKVDVPGCDDDEESLCIEEVMLPTLGKVSATAISSSSLTCTEIRSRQQTVTARATPIPLLRKPYEPNNNGTRVPSMLDAKKPDEQMCLVLSYDILANPESGTAYMVITVARANADATVADTLPMKQPQCSLTLEASVVIINER